VISSSVSHRAQRRIIGFDGIDSSAAAPLVGQLLTVPETWVAELPEGEYFHFQLLGMKVVTESGEFLGEIGEVIETGSNDVYVVSGDNGQVLIPAISTVVKDVRPDIGLMVVQLMEGMR
jgi:16S rRNA processing protein RimM